MMLEHRLLYLSLCAALLGCGGEDDDPAAQEHPALSGKRLEVEPAGAPPPSATAGYLEVKVENASRLTCLATDYLPEAGSSTVTLPGYVRSLADPGAKGGASSIPEVVIQLFGADGIQLAPDQFPDKAKKGRVAISVGLPDKEQGFAGHAWLKSQPEAGEPKEFLDYRFQVSRPVKSTSFAAWAWMTTQTEVDERAKALVEVQPDQGIVFGAVHDCDGFGVPNAIVLVDGEAADVYYVEGFEIEKSRTYTSETGRFVAPNISPGKVRVEAYGRLEPEGPLILLSSMETEVVSGAISAVALEPRIE